MGEPHLRIFPAPGKVPHRGSLASVRLGDIAPLLADAYQHDRTWLRDFQDHHIHIPSDLHEVLKAYCQLQSPA